VDFDSIRFCLLPEYDDVLLRDIYFVPFLAEFENLIKGMDSTPRRTTAPRTIDR
jgi:hypothetical protein